MAELQEKNQLEHVIKFFSFLYVLLITCGLAYNYVFYKSFGITITEYIELGESLLLFLPLLGEPFTLTMVSFLAFHFALKEVIFSSNESALFGSSKSLHKAIFTTFIVMTVLSLIFYVIYNITKKFDFTFYSLIVFTIVFLLPLILEISLKNNKNILPPVYRNVLYTFIILITITAFTSYTKSRRVRRKLDYKEFKISFRNNDSDLRGDSSILYLGRTKNYLFIHDSKTHQSRVLNVSDIKEFITSE